MAHQLASQLLSALPMEESVWTADRIQKHNQILENLLKSEDEVYYQRNREVILECVRERVRFMKEVQEKYRNTLNKNKGLKEKIDLLKEPLKGLHKGPKKKNNQDRSIDSL